MSPSDHDVKLAEGDTMSKIKQVKELLDEIINLGLALEANDYNNKFVGYPGFTKESQASEKRRLMRKAKRVFNKLGEMGVDLDSPEFSDYKNDEGMDLEYSLQFI